MKFKIEAIALPGLFILLWILYQQKAMFFIDSDEGITGLMGLHINQGRQIPIFYYGQQYIGPLESLLASFFFEFLGTSTVTLKLAPLFFFVLAGLFGYRVLEKNFSRKAGVIFLVIFFIPGHFLLEWSGKARGNFTYLLLSVFIFLDILPKDKTGLKSGLFLGFSWWMNPQILSLIASFLLLNIQKVFGFSIGFLVGAFPVILANISSGFGTVNQLIKPSITDVMNNIEGFLKNFLPILLGFKRIFDGNPTPAFLTTPIFFILLLLGIRKALILGGNLSNLIKVNIFNVLIFIALFIFSKFGSLSLEPRYGMVAYASMAFIGSVILADIKNFYLIPLLGLFSTIKLSTIFDNFQIKPTGPTYISPDGRVPRDLQTLSDQLLDKGIKAIRAPYWVAYSLAFILQEKIAFELIREPFSRRVSYLTHADLRFIPVLDHNNTVKYYTDLAKLSNLNLQVETFNPNLSLFYFRNKEEQMASDFSVTSKFNANMLDNLKDGSLDSYWHSGNVSSEYYPLEVIPRIKFKGIFICTSSNLEDIPDSIEIILGKKIVQIQPEWLNFLKSSRCLSYLFNSCFREDIKFKVRFSEGRRYYFSLSELRLLTCE